MQPIRLIISTIVALGISGAALAQETEAQPDFNEAPWRLSVSLAGTSPSGGLVAQAAVSHDDLLGPLGVRLATEYGFGVVPFSVTAGVISVAPIGFLDLHAGLGAGASMESTGVLLYGELLLGASYRFTDYLGVYTEARFRPYFDGSADGVGGVAAGLQLRF